MVNFLSAIDRKIDAVSQQINQMKKGSATETICLTGFHHD
jgi:hypothetical protein